jgi:hypothetical protein
MNYIKKNIDSFTCIFGRPIFHGSGFQKNIQFIKNGEKRECGLMYIRGDLNPPIHPFHHSGISGFLGIEEDCINFDYMFGTEILWYYKFNIKSYIEIDPLGDPLYERDDNSMLKIFDYLERINNNILFY